jgi:hypothetical protein
LWGDERRVRTDDVSGAGAYTHMTMLADNTVDAQPLQDEFAGLASTRSTPNGRASTVSCSTRYGKRADRDDRLPQR